MQAQKIIHGSPFVTGSPIILESPKGELQFFPSFERVDTWAATRLSERRDYMRACDREQWRKEFGDSIAHQVMFEIDQQTKE